MPRKKIVAPVSVPSVDEAGKNYRNALLDLIVKAKAKVDAAQTELDQGKERLSKFESINGVPSVVREVKAAPKVKAPKPKAEKKPKTEKKTKKAPKKAKAPKAEKRVKADGKKLTHNDRVIAVFKADETITKAQIIERMKAKDIWFPNKDPDTTLANTLSALKTNGVLVSPGRAQYRINATKEAPTVEGENPFGKPSEATA